MPKSKFRIIAALAAFLTCQFAVGCEGDEGSQFQQVYPEESPPAPRFEYSSPEIGMSYADWKRVCIPRRGDLGLKDRIQTVKSQSGLTTYVTLHLEFNEQGEQRLERGCAGTFRFHNDVLESVVGPRF